MSEDIYDDLDDYWEEDEEELDRIREDLLSDDDFLMFGYDGWEDEF